MRHVVLLLLTCAVAFPAAAQPAQYDRHVVFDHSRTDTSYFFSEATATPPSTLDGPDDRVPVTDARFVTPPNALRLSWTSEVGGDWQATIRPRSFRNRQGPFTGTTLAFSVWSADTLTEQTMPRLRVTDGQGLSASVSLPTYQERLPGQAWTQVHIPLDSLVYTTGSGETFDPQTLASLTFVQGLDDGVAHTLILDDVKIYSPDSTDTQTPDSPTDLAATGYERHVSLTWSLVSTDNLQHVRIERSVEGRPFTPVGTQAARPRSLRRRA